jgi:succinate dehydrogenase / fumarate reductase membrane anchor subunit
MVKSVLGVNHQGLRDWLFQRVSAIVMAIYSTGLIAYFVLHHQLVFADWHALFAHTWMKVATLSFFISLGFHGWVGMWTINTDYIKIFGLRLLAQLFVLIALVVYTIWAFAILWGI